MDRLCPGIGVSPHAEDGRASQLKSSANLKVPGGCTTYWNGWSPRRNGQPLISRMGGHFRPEYAGTGTARSLMKDRGKVRRKAEPIAPNLRMTQEAVRAVCRVG